MPLRAVTAAACLALASPLALLTSPAHAAPPSTLAKPYDFDGDGHPDLAVGAPTLTASSHAGAGGVFVVPSRAAGQLIDLQVITQTFDEIPGDPEVDGHFGAALASADFDRDGYADLAIAAPNADVGLAHDAGLVTIVYGSRNGLFNGSSTRTSELAQVSGPEDDAGFGTSLATGDVNGDGWPDLAVGSPSAGRLAFAGKDYEASGYVSVWVNGPEGFLDVPSYLLTGNRTRADYDVHFGSTVALSDLDLDGNTDLVVGSTGVAYEDGDGYPGRVTTCYGNGQTITPCSQLAWRGSALQSLAVGNVTGSARPEIVLGVVPDRGEEDETGGSVWTLALAGRGTATTATAEELTQDSKGVPGSNEDDDEFGYTVTLHDVDHDGYADLVVGSPGEAVGSRRDAGRVTLVHGGKKGYRASGNTAWDQDAKGVPGVAETGDRFGTAITLVDRNTDGHVDLVVGAPGENHTGYVTTLFGAETGFTTQAAKSLSAATFNEPDAENATFGETLAGGTVR